MKKIIIFFSIAILAFSFVSCGNISNKNSTSETNVLKIGAIPDQNALKLNKRFDELAEYLQKEIGIEVQYVPSIDYSALVTAFKRHEIHLGWFGGLTGVQARNSVKDSEAIAQRPRDEEFHSVFIVNNNVDGDSLEDLKGLSFTFGSESSTSGHLMPRHYLIDAGIDPDNDFDGGVSYSGSHDKTWKLVESNAFQAGVLNEAVWEIAVNSKKVDLDKVRVLYTTPAYYDYNWTINNVDKSFGVGTKDKVLKALLSFGEKNPELIKLFQAEKFIKTSNKNYEAIENVAKKLGIIK